MSVSSEKLNLPPNVPGKTQGYLDFSIENIIWKTSKTFGDVKVNLLWWGQSDGILCEGIKVNVNKSKIPEEPLRTLRYQIKTSNRLFLSYLKHCEPLKIDIFSTKTGDFIGSSKFEIPLKFHNSSEIQDQRCKISLQILSSRKFSLGEIVVSIKINQIQAMTHKISSTLRDTKRTKSVDEPAVVLKEKNSNKENIQVIGSKKRISFRDPKPVKPATLIKIPQKEKAKTEKVFKPIQKYPSQAAPLQTKPVPNENETLLRSQLNNKTSEKSSLINYLSGEPMSRVDECNFIHNLATISPSASIIEALNTVGSTKPQRKLRLSDKLNSIRITISQVELSPAGQLETQNFMNKNRFQKSIIKCVVTSKCFRSDEDVRLISSVFETAPKRISFSKEITQRFSTPIERDRRNVFINFGFCVKSIEQQSSSFFLGYSRVDLTDVINASSMFHKKCSIISESDMKVGSVTVKLELGINGLHFGRDLIDSLYCQRGNVSVCSDNSTSCERPIRLDNQKFNTKSHPSHSNDQCEADRNYDNKNVQTEKSTMGSGQGNSNLRDISDERDTEMVDVERDKNSVTSKVYNGLLFIEELRNVKDRLPVDYFITYEGFWNECQESTDISIALVFNYLKNFPVICDESFLKRVQNNHLELKLWEKSGQSEKWIGSTKLPLHQFFIAFRDVAMIQHLSLNQLPIISIDTWTNFVSPLSSELFCQGKVLLAIGSENQIEYFKLMRNLHNLRLPERKKSVEVQADDVKTRNSPDPNAQMKNKLSAFIESLSQKLPEPSLMNNFHKTSSTVSSAASSIASEPSQQMRKTSELMESLQKALSQSSAPVHAPPIQTANRLHQSVTPDSSLSSISIEKVKMLITIDHASHLPKVVVKKKQNRRKNKSPTTPQKIEFEPSAYATFESCVEQLSESSHQGDVVKSHEGIVHCTNVLKSCDPQWNRSFNVHLPVDVMLNPQKRFVVKVWRKVGQDSDMKVAPFEDAVIGFSTIDLSVLLTGLPILSGYYNIMDFSGRCNGQIKLSLKPLEDLLPYQDSSTSLPVVNSLMHPLNVDVGSSDEAGSNLLSRTLKRKFTELDEITQRLKARLFDVTGDENLDHEDEFERDLNTAVDEMDEDNDRDFEWLKNDANNGGNFQSQLEQLLHPQPSTSKDIAGSSSTLTTQRQVSGCSNPQPMAIDLLLKKYDLDTLINPSIFKNILDPTLANSDSTPTLNPHPVNSEDLANVSADSGDTTVSSILSNDQIQTIQKAFQKASLAEGSDQSSSRKDPDGENYASE